MADTGLADGPCLSFRSANSGCVYRTREERLKSVEVTPDSCHGEWQITWGPVALQPELLQPAITPTSPQCAPAAQHSSVHSQQTTRGAGLTCSTHTHTLISYNVEHSPQTGM